MNRVKVTLWLLWMGFLGGLMITGIGLWRLVDDSAWFAPGERVEATVVAIIPPVGEGGSPSPVLQWQDADGAIHRMSSPNSASYLAEGERVELVTQPLDPTATRIRSVRAVSPTAYIPILAGIALALLAAMRLRR